MRPTGERAKRGWAAIARRISDWFNTAAEPPDPKPLPFMPALRDYPTRVRRQAPGAPGQSNRPAGWRGAPNVPQRRGSRLLVERSAHHGEVRTDVPRGGAV
jgi:hypothetical protein